MAEKKSWYKTWWGISIIVSAAMMMIGLIVVGLVIGAIINTFNQEGGQVTKITPTTEKPKKIPPGPAKEEKTEFAVGEIIQLNNHQLKVNSVNKNLDTNNPYLKPQKPENVFVTVNVTLTNTSEKDLDVNMFGFKLEDETGTQRSTTFFSGVEGMLESVTLSPKGTTTGNLGFEAKKDSKTLKLHYSPGVAGGKEIFVNL